MTAPDAMPDGTTVEQLAAALCRYADVQPEAAAIELLIGHNAWSSHWLRRAPFVACVSWLPADDEADEPMAEVDWPAVAEVLATGEGLFDTLSERAVLAVAASLAHGELAVAVSSCDVHNRRLIAAAVAEALGLSWGDVMTAAQR